MVVLDRLHTAQRPRRALRAAAAPAATITIAAVSAQRRFAAVSGRAPAVGAAAGSGSGRWNAVGGRAGFGCGVRAGFAALGLAGAGSGARGADRGGRAGCSGLASGGAAGGGAGGDGAGGADGGGGLGDGQGHGRVGGGRCAISTDAVGPAAEGNASATDTASVPAARTRRAITAACPVRTRTRPAGPPRRRCRGSAARVSRTAAASSWPRASTRSGCGSAAAARRTAAAARAT